MCTPVKHPVMPGLSISRVRPVNLREGDISYFEEDLVSELPDVYLVHKKNIFATSDGFLFSGLRILRLTLPGLKARSMYFTLKDRLKFYFLNCLKFLFVKKLPGEDYLWITDVWSFGFFHWMTEALPRLVVAQERIGGIQNLLLPQKLEEFPFVQASLRPLFSGNIVFTDKISCCSRLCIPTHIASPGNYSEYLVRRLRTSYTKAYPCLHGSKDWPEKLYISRGKASKRRILNEDICIGILESYGFHALYMEDYDFESQVCIARSAKFLISNHGGGLTNILFMQEGSSVMELRKIGDRHNNCYFNLASAMGVRYFYQLCQAFAPDEDSHTADLIVDCEKLKKNIELMLA